MLYHGNDYIIMQINNLINPELMRKNVVAGMTIYRGY